MVSTKEKETLPKITELKNQIKELENKYEKLRASVGYDELQGWQPRNNNYGWVYSWLKPLYDYLRGKTTPEIRNQAVSITQSIISQLTIYGKYGIKIPNETRDVNWGATFEKPFDENKVIYLPCDVCGENRITHDCHIIPRTFGGVNHKDNFITLCPLHHHLFDHARLTPVEWKTILKAIEAKMESAVIYTKEVRYKYQEQFWKNTNQDFQ